jgi:phage virion morphogenesis protein
MSIGVTINGLESLVAIDARISRLADLDLRDLLEGIGAEGESQTRRRIRDEKFDADGVAWEPWSDHYERTRKSNHSLLINDQDLLDTLSYEVESDAVSWGSDQVYAATHQFGRGAIPARPFLGLSDSNHDDIEQLVVDFLDGMLQ